MAEEDDASDDDSGNNGLLFRPSYSDNCITTQNKKCGHSNMATVSLNKVGDFVAFPALWIHHGYYTIQSEGTVIFQAQLFAVPSSDIFASKRTIRSNIAMKSHTKRNFCNIRKETLEPLTDNLLHHWDDTYWAEKFPPPLKFQGIKIDKAKNRHILKCYIHSLPKIEQFVNAFEQIVGGITVNSVWLLKKSKEDDDFQKWHQDMKFRITTTIVVNVGVATVSPSQVSEHHEEDESVAAETVNNNVEVYSAMKFIS